MTEPHRADPELDLGGCPIELIRGAWDITTLMLKRLDADQCLRLSRVRQAYLDEIESRNPVEFHRWMLDFRDGRASGNLGAWSAK